MEFLTFIPFYVTIILVLLGTALIIVEMLLPGLGAPGRCPSRLNEPLCPGRPLPGPSFPKVRCSVMP